MNPNQCRCVRSQMQITRPHLHRPLQIRAHHTAVLRLPAPTRLRDQIPQHLHLLSRQ